ncbi:MAG: RsmG family class I SAM-dependent methyltransferase [Polyangiaceae bacterium]
MTALDEAAVARYLADCGAAEAAQPGLWAWLEGITAWNRRIDLTAARDEDELLDLMLADAVTIAEVLPRREPAQKVVDVGTGAGAPGLPLALLRPDLAVTLVEPLQKRVAFLRVTQGRLAQLGGPSFALQRGKGEAVRERFDVALSRATLAPPVWLALGARLAPQGEVLVLLAREPAPEPPEGMALLDDHRYRWPRTGAERRLLRYGRMGE